MLALAEIRDQVHRPRPVQRHQRDDVLEAIRPGILQHALHAAAFELEHGDGLGLGQQLVGRLVVQRQFFQAEIGHGRIELADVAHRAIQDRQRGQSQEVELDQADRLDVVLVVLRHHAGIAALGVQRAKIGQLAGRDQHAAGVHADAARDALDLLRQRQQLPHLFLVFLALGQQRLFLQRIGNRHQLARLERNQLGNAVAEVVAHVEHAADVAHRALGRHGAEGGDLRHRILAVAILDVLDHAVAAFLAKVDIEVGHRDPFRVQEALEQQVVFKRIEIGDLQRIRDQRTGAGTAAGTDRHAVVLGPLDEVGDDQEVAGETHLDDGVGLELQARLVARPLPFAFLLVRIQLQQTLFQAFVRLQHQELVDRHAVGRREIGQLRLAQFQRQVAALGDFHRVLQGCRQVGEQFRHLGLGLEALLLVETPGAPRIGQNLAGRNAGTRFVRGEFLAVQELHRMRRHHRQSQLRRQRDRLPQFRFRLTGALHLDVEMPGEKRRPAPRATFGGGQIAVAERHADVAELRARQCDQAARRALPLQVFQPFGADFGAPAMLVGQPCLGQQFAQLQVAGTIFHQQQQARRLVTVFVVADPGIAADDRLDALAARRLVELDHAEQVGQVGDGQRRLAVGGGGAHRIVDAHQSIDDRIFGMQAQVNELRGSHGRHFTVPERAPKDWLRRQVYNTDESMT